MGNLTQYGCRFMSENNTEQTSKYEKSCYSLKFNAIGVLSCFGKVLTDNIYKQNCHERRASTQRIVGIEVHDIYVCSGIEVHDIYVYCTYCTNLFSSWHVKLTVRM